MKTFSKLLICLLIILTSFINLRADDALEDDDSPSTIAKIPVYYPDKVIGNSRPYFIWYDKYNDRDDKSVRYRITLKPEKGKEIQPVLTAPEKYHNNYYYFKIPFLLEPDKYSYLIERLSDGKTTMPKYFHYLKYPVKGEFILDPEEKTARDNLPTDRLIEYLRLEKENKLVNGYNFVFYNTAAAGAFGIGMLFYKVFHFGIISKIIYIIAFTSSGAGVCAGTYYGINYLVENSKLQKIVDIGPAVSLNGNVSPATVRADFALSF